MPSTPSPLLGIELQELGENLNTWGKTRLNEALRRLEEAIADAAPLALTGGTYALGSTYYVANESRAAALLLTGTLTANQALEAPAKKKLYLVVNNLTQGAFSVTIKTNAGTGYALRPGPQWVYCDGADFYRATPRLDQVPAPTASVDLNGQRVTNLAQGTASSDAVTKAQMETAIAGGAIPAASGAVKVTVGDTAPQYLDGAVQVTADLTKTVANPGADEALLLGLPDTGIVAGTYDAATVTYDGKGRAVAVTNSGWVRSNVILLFLRDEIQNAIAAGNMVDGVTDAFVTDTLGSTSTGEYYDAAGGYYSGLAITTSYANAGGTGDRTGSVTVTSSGFSGGTDSNFVDGATGSNSTDARDTAGAAATSLSIVFDFGSAKYIDEARMKFSAAAAGGVFRWQCGDSGAGPWTDCSADWTAGSSTTVTSALTMEYTGHRCLKVAGVSGTTSGSPWWTEAEFRVGGAPAGGPAAFTLVTPPVPAETQPDDVHVLLLHKAVGAVLLNTDIIASVSRDGGATWTAVTLTDDGAYDGEYTILTGAADISAQPTGASMALKIACTAVEQRIRGFGEAWG